MRIQLGFGARPCRTARSGGGFFEGEAKNHDKSGQTEYQRVPIIKTDEYNKPQNICKAVVEE